ncbi:MAG: thiol peroxidase [Bacteroidales bacterium]|jgi:thiol peroxidase|nr:thiol peroxidase [Bacteroidales bacterium]MBP9979254.1 thiol peroxidase [Bacteroidales bacterium]WRQ32863.1 thiol peroxidase [Bacteroidales bacterium MB20-C3-3]
MKDLFSIETKGIFAAKGNPLTLLGNQIKPGDAAPEIIASDNTLKDVKLSDFKGKVVVVSVFPSIDTGVCATQTRTFNKRATELSEDVVILTMSKDLPFALGRFCAAEGINNIHTLSDFKFSKFGLEYGFLVKENQLLARGVVVIDKNGVVKYKEITKDILDEPNYDLAIAAVKELL